MAMTDGALTFAIPCRDGERHLPALLRSLLAQTVPCRLLLLDDASSDASVSVARAVAGDALAVVRNDEALGIPGNWNRAADLVGTEFFCLAHQDDVYAPEFGAAMLEALRCAPDAAAAHCPARAIDDEGRVLHSLPERYKARFWRSLPPAEPPESGFRRLFGGNYVNCASLVYRRAAFVAVGRFDADFRFAPDWEWLLRAHAKGWRLAAVPHALVSYRRHPRQATQQAARSLRRYREEHAILQSARAVGEGILPQGGRSNAMRDNLLYDAFADLEAGELGAARDKLELLAELDPRARRSAPARAVATALRLGWPARKALSLALSGYVGLVTR
ncbi:MAG: glycosyltransferase [Planctomycetota bacterium]